jgi:hypothetical protein
MHNHNVSHCQFDRPNQYAECIFGELLGKELLL